MTNGKRHSLGYQLARKVVSLLGVTDWTITQIDPVGMRYVANMLAWAHWALGVFVVVQLLYRPFYGYWAPQFVAYLLFLVLLMSFNGYFHYLVLSNRTVTGRLVWALCMVDVTLLSIAVAISNGFSHYFFYLLYYPPLAFFAAVITSFRLNMACVTIVAAIYVGLSLTAGDGLDFEARDEKPLLARIFVMYVVVALVNLISGFERTRWRRSLEREQALLHERTRLSQTIHDTTAQSAYMVGLGIDTAKALSGNANSELAASLEATSELSRSMIWGLRQPISMGGIYDGRELNRVLMSHASSFTNITSVSAEVTQKGVEPPLSVEARSLLFSIAHNALTNAYRHAQATRVEIDLNFDGKGVRLSVSDDGTGLPADYAQRGQGFTSMSRDAERLGGRLVVDRRGSLGGATIACVIPDAVDAQKEK